MEGVIEEIPMIYTDTDSIWSSKLNIEIPVKKISNQNIILENMMIGDETIENYEEKYGKNSMEYIRIKKIEEEIKYNYYLDIYEDEYEIKRRDKNFKDLNLKDYMNLLSSDYIYEYHERIRKMFYYWEFEKIKKYLLKDREYQKVYKKYPEYKKLVENVDENKGLSKKYKNKFRNKLNLKDYYGNEVKIDLSDIEEVICEKYKEILLKEDEYDVEDDEGAESDEFDDYEKEDWEKLYDDD